MTTLWYSEKNLIEISEAFRLLAFFCSRWGHLEPLSASKYLLVFEYFAFFVFLYVRGCRFPDLRLGHYRVIISNSAVSWRVDCAA